MSANIYKYIFFNNKIIPKNKVKISFYDFGFLYGDGVFETLRVYNKNILRFSQHFQRLKQGLNFLKIKINFKEKDLLNFCQQVILKNNTQDCLLRIQITRGEGIPRNIFSCNKPTIIIFASPLPQKKLKSAAIAFSSFPNINYNQGIKTTNYLHFILGKLEAKEKKVFEVIFLNNAGYVTEGTTSNIFLIKNNCLWTPALQNNILAGVTRSLILETAKELNITCKETSLTNYDFFNADEIFLSATSFEILPVRKINNLKINYQKNNLTAKIYKALKNKIKGETLG